MCDEIKKKSYMYSTVCGQLTIVSRETRLVSRECTASTVQMLHILLICIKCIQNYRTLIYMFGEIRAHDARLNKLNNQTLVHGEIQYRSEISVQRKRKTC